VNDADSSGGSFAHWVVFDIPSSVSEMAEGQPVAATLGNGGKQGINDYGQTGYGGPAPPAGTTHRYFFKIYALDAMLNLSTVSTDFQVINAMQGHILGEAEYMGTYSA
jgi:Raf kinase inhibitor-like YbhB/YbcL family protein